MWPLVTYSNYFEIVSNVPFPNSQTGVFNTILILLIIHSTIYAVPDFRYCNINLLKLNFYCEAGNLVFFWPLTMHMSTHLYNWNAFLPCCLCNTVQVVSFCRCSWSALLLRPWLSIILMTSAIYTDWKVVALV